MEFYKEKANLESELAKLLDSYNKVYGRYKQKQKEIKEIRKEKKALQIEINKKLMDYRKFI